jgi:hypothetical protein
MKPFVARYRSWINGDIVPPGTTVMFPDGFRGDANWMVPEPAVPPISPPAPPAPDPIPGIQSQIAELVAKIAAIGAESHARDERDRKIVAALEQLSP